MLWILVGCAVALPNGQSIQNLYNQSMCMLSFVKVSVCFTYLQYSSEQTFTKCKPPKPKHAAQCEAVYNCVSILSHFETVCSCSIKNAFQIAVDDSSFDIRDVESEYCDITPAWLAADVISFTCRYCNICSEKWSPPLGDVHRLRLVSKVITLNVEPEYGCVQIFAN